MLEQNNADRVHDDQKAIGHRLRLRRKVRGASLQQIADAAGISVTQLSLVERGHAQPSLRTLRSVCEALKMPMSWLFDNQNGGSEAEGGIVMRAHQRRRFDLGPSGVAKDLLTGDQCREIQLMQLTVPPEGSTGLEPFKTGPAARCGVVTHGRLGLEVDGDSFILETGDSFSFAKRETCKLWSESTEPCVVIWAVAPAIY